MQSAPAVRREIERPAIRFGLDDASGGLALGGAMHEDFPDALARDSQHRLRIKLARQFAPITAVEPTPYPLPLKWKGGPERI